MRKNKKTQLGKPILLSSCDPEVWNMVAEAKQVLIRTGEIPDYADFIPEEIVDMWKASINYGIKWDDDICVPRLDEAELAALSERKRLFIDVAAEFIGEFQSILEDTDFTMSITDENGVLLSKTKNSDRLWSKYLKLDIGDIWSEKYVGCTAHTLALTYNRPVQIIGPVNYYKLLESNLSSAAPIFNEYGDTIGTIRLVQKNADITRLMTHTLGWVTSVATAISSHMKLLRRDKRLKLMDSTLDATFAYAEKGYVSIDEDGYIININKIAEQLLDIKKADSKRTFFSLMTDPEPIINALKTGRPACELRMCLTSDETQELLCNIQPFHGDRKKHAQGAIVRITKKEDVARIGGGRCDAEITFDRIIGSCLAMERVKETAKMVSRNPINILLLGESGTGKEVFAQAIHNFYFKSGPFVAINCAAIPVNLIESELFGYEKGAFTGAAVNGKKGKIEMANGGTLFLDEIGDMPVELQPVLLRVLEEKRVTRIGGDKSIPVDFRIISATNQSIGSGALCETFRQDLYFRLAVVNLELPPLRERGDDVLLLAEHFIRSTCNNFNMPTRTLSPDTEQILMGYNWPGNVRQLQNAMMYAVTVSDGKVIIPEHLPKELLDMSQHKLNGKLDAIKNIEKDMILKTIDELGSAKEAAKQLGISRATLYRKIK
jgi:transcriptional regulator with PAS, ATPase and Fis domain